MSFIDDARNRELPDDGDDKWLDDGDSFSLKTAKLYVKKKQLPVPYMSPEELEDLEFPSDMTILNNEQLTQAMSDWTKLMSYTNYTVAQTDVEKTAKKSNYEFLKSKHWAIMRGDGKSEEDTRKGVDKIVNVAEAKKEFEVAVAKHKLLDSLLWGYTKSYQMLSRELTKRGIINIAEGKDTE